MRHIFSPLFNSVNNFSLDETAISWYFIIMGMNYQYFGGA